jgi:glycosyltransferase involved in cell wall biosynthesis
MKIVFISSWYSEGMGYSENMFPKAMGKLGVDVHLITSTAQIYYHHPQYSKIYQPYLGPNIVSEGIKEEESFTLHRLPYYETKNIFRGPGITKLYEYLDEIKPDVIQTFEILPETTLIAAQYANEKNCLFFTECHTHASIFRKGNRRGLKERIKSILNLVSPQLNYINRTTKICYPIAEDVADLAVNFYKVPRKKIKIQSLGVDTEIFCPPVTIDQKANRGEIREKYGFQPEDIVCIYTGRFTKDKNPHCLAKAIDELNERGRPFKALFIGNGPKEDIEFIQSQKGCKVGAFVPANQLPKYYWSADIGVWPREESTSQLDAAACGLPLILSKNIKVLERVQGNGLLYEEGDHLDLADKLEKLSDSEMRNKMSRLGSEKIANNYSWNRIASQRLNDYKSFNLVVT